MEKSVFKRTFTLPESVDYRLEIIDLAIDVPHPSMKQRFAVIHKQTGILAGATPSLPEAIAAMQGQQEALDQLVGNGVAAPPGRSLAN